MDDGCFSEVCTVKRRTNDVIQVDSVIYSRGLEKRTMAEKFHETPHFFFLVFQLPLFTILLVIRFRSGRYQWIILPLVNVNYKEVWKGGTIFSRTYKLVAVAERA